MNPLLFLVLCFSFTSSFSQTINVLQQELTSGSQKKWDLNQNESDSVSRGTTLFTMKFHLPGKKVEVHSCKRDSCLDNLLRWQLDSVDSKFTISFTKNLDGLLDTNKFEIQFVSKGGSKFLRFRRPGQTVERGTLDYYFQ